MYFVPPLILGGTRAISQNLELNAHSKILTLTVLSFRASVGLDVGNSADHCGAERLRGSAVWLSLLLAALQDNTHSAGYS